MMDAPKDPFSAVRRRILREALSRAPFEGFTPTMLERAAVDAAVSPAELSAALPGGTADLLALWSAEADAAAAASLEGDGAAGLRIREKVARAIEARLDFLSPGKEAARRAAATLALPHLAPLAARLAWNTSDSIWRALGDKSTDFNFYSKRAILTGVWLSTFARWLADETDGYAETRAFLAARIDNVMQFERVKAKARNWVPDPSAPLEWLARLRYPRGR